MTGRAISTESEVSWGAAKIEGFGERLTLLMTGEGDAQVVGGDEFVGEDLGEIVFEVFEASALGGGVEAHEWEGARSLRLNAICVGHEVVMFTVQGAILGVWW